MTSLITPFPVIIRCGSLYIGHNANVQSTIVNRYLTNISKLEKSSFVENPDAHFMLKISANQDLEHMLPDIFLYGVDQNSKSAVIINTCMLL